MSGFEGKPRLLAIIVLLRTAIIVPEKGRRREIKFPSTREAQLTLGSLATQEGQQDGVGQPQEKEDQACGGQERPQLQITRGQRNTKKEMRAIVTSNIVFHF